ncbi:MAG TPA: hypothetical protein VE710_03655 [Candidatus Bathyarchaeia archaeon]|nr:hypothetical protein [Candidatus Bathyarchaeia archaeon]
MNNEQKAADTLKWFAWAASLIGVLLFVLNVTDFRAENFGLMASIGFLIAGMNIFLLSTVFRLMHIKKQEV